MRLEKALGISADSWMAMQHGYEVDLLAIEREKASTLQLQERVAALEEKVQLLMSALASESTVEYKKKD